MESNVRKKQTAAAAAFLLPGMFGLCYLAGLENYFLLFAGIWAALMLAVLMKPHVSLKQLTAISMYILTAATFLNQSLLSIHAGFFTLFIYRILLMVTLVLFIWQAAAERELPLYWKDVRVKGILLFLLFWLAYGCVSLLWAQSVVDGIKYLFLLGLGIAFVFLSVFIFRSKTRLMGAAILWMLMSGLLMAIGLMNHFLHMQLPTSTLYGGPDYKLSYPTSVFTNQNDFATFLVISFFFYLAAVKNSRNGTVKAAGILLAVLALYLIYLTESRASELGVMAGIGLYILLLLPPVLKKPAWFAGGAAVLAGCWLMKDKLGGLWQELLAGPGNQAKYESLPSNEARLNLLKNVMHDVADSYGFGVGAGNVSVRLKTGPIFHTNYVVEAHNWLAEILGSFGLVVFLGYCLMCAFLLCSLYRAHGTTNRIETFLIEASFLGLAGFLVSSISPSTVSNLYFHWVLLGFVIAVIARGTVPQNRMKESGKWL
ncbi:teichuronic acid biosynthesis protein TuaE [Peribacillus kribbensis]|uniref:teichuronic acid biosynthesis protein TuaE n=1 Tax=Peribacillus kribbensis TaxID=356658 RepID=UPI00041DAB65|nr:O-antigen ligase family protein [Peribacillus kribbensis]